MSDRSRLRKALTEGQLIRIYNGFCDEFGSSREQLTDLIEHLSHFKHSLEQHKKVLMAHSLKETEYVGYEAIQRTLKECQAFLSTYEVVLDDDKKTKLKTGYKVIRLVFNQDGINQLHRKIERLEGTLTLHLALENALEKGSPEISSASTSSSKLPTVAPPTPQLVGRPLPDKESEFDVYRRSQRPEKSGANFSDEGWSHSPVKSPSSPRTERARSSVADSSSMTASPTRTGIGKMSELDAPLPLVLPQAALDYSVVDIVYDRKVRDFDRRPMGRDWEGGREIVIIDESSIVLYSHKIICPQQETCIPYTWHSKWKSHDPYEITFKGTDAEGHFISFDGDTGLSTIPKYIFSKDADFKDFQEQVSGMELIDTFEVHRISSAISPSSKGKIVGDALHQHLKCWKSRTTKRYTITYYASNLRPPKHFEFQLSSLHYNASESNEFDIRLSFSDRSAAPALVKPSRTSSWNLSRAPTLVEKAPSSTTTGTSARRSTGGNASSGSSFMTIPSQSSGGSHQFDLSHVQTGFSSIAEKMQYMEVEFDTKAEAARFLKQYNDWQAEEASLSLFELTEKSWTIDSKGKSKDPDVEKYLALSPLGASFSSPDMLAGHFDIAPENKTEDKFG